jgi:hypothetical protein
MFRIENNRLKSQHWSDLASPPERSIRLMHRLVRRALGERLSAHKSPRGAFAETITSGSLRA